MAQRRQSAPSIVIRGVLGKHSKLPASLYNKDDSCVPLSPMSNSQRLSLKFGSHGAMLNLSKRQYVMEGKVQLTTGMQTQDRYMFLFTDLLLIAKAKSGSNYKLKYRIRVCEMWIATCLDEVCELAKSQEKSFVIGWPTTNCVATFSTNESKELWLSALIKKINDEKEKESPKTTVLKVISRDVDNSSHVKLVTVSHKHTAKDVVRLALKEFELEEREDEYHLWVMSRKEGTAYPLIGHEIPHAIQVSHIRDSVSSNGIVPEMDVTSISEHDILTQTDIRNRCQFVLRNSRQSPSKLHFDQTQRRLSRIKNKTPAALFNWARKRHATGGTLRQESSDSGLASMSGNSGTDGSSFSSSPPSTSSRVSRKLFSRSLDDICENGEIPAQITEMLNVLFRKAPYTTGIFRKSANAKTTRLLKEKLDDEQEVDMDDVPIHVIAALFKDFMRNIPNSLLNSALYPSWTEAIEKPDDDGKMSALREFVLQISMFFRLILFHKIYSIHFFFTSLLRNIGDVNKVLLRRLVIVLTKIASHSKRNNMTSFNLSVCIAPSVLWPPASAGPFTQADATRKVTEILQFMVDRSSEIFDGIVPDDDAWCPNIDQQSEGEEIEEYEGESENLMCVSQEETIEPDINLAPEGLQSEDAVDGIEDEAEDHSDISHFNRSRMIRRQLQRRRPHSRCERTERLSQDSIEQELNDENLEIENEQNNLQAVNHTRGGTDACSMSNDSGFTTLSGEDEDVSLSTSAKRRLDNISTAQNPELLFSSSAGANLFASSDGLEHTLSSAKLELRDLWDPSLLVTSGGKIVDDLEPKMNSNGAQSFCKSVSEHRRRSSQPELAHRKVEKGFSVDNTVDDPFFASSKASRLVDALTTPTVEYADDSDTSEYDGLAFTFPANRQRPTYMRLNDIKDKNVSNKESNCGSHGLADEYLRNLRNQDTDEVVQNLSGPLKYSHINANGSLDETFPETIRPSTLTLTLSLEKQRDTKESSLNTDPERAEHETTSSFHSQLKSSSNVIAASDASHEVESVTSTPFGRKANSLRENRDHRREVRKAQSHGRADRENRRDFENRSQLPLSPIQKLTENLNSIPDFRQKSFLNQNAFDRDEAEEAMPYDRRKSSSVKLHRSHNHRQFRGLQAHCVKLKTPVNLNGSNRVVVGRNDNNIESHYFNGGAEKNEVADNIVVSRRRRNRLPAETSVSQNGDSDFSKSLPSRDWRQLQKISPSSSSDRLFKMDVRLGGRNVNTREGRQSRSTARSSRRCKSREKQLEISISLNDIDVKPKKCSMPEAAELSETSSRRPVESLESLESLNVSVKSKINAFNHIISNHNSHSTPSKLGGKELGTSMYGSTKDLSTVPSPSHARATFVQLESMLVDVHPEHNSARAKSGDLSHERSYKNSVGTIKTNSSDRTKPILRQSSPSDHRDGDRLATDENLRFTSESSRHKRSASQRRPSPQPLSDNILFSLSESFAFGNRKSPRCLTPNGTPNRGNTPHDSPVSPRRSVPRTTASKFPLSERKSGKWNEIGTRECLPDEGSSKRRNSHERRKKLLDTALNAPPSFRKDNNDNNELIPFKGFEKVMHSEESYV